MALIPHPASSKANHAASALAPAAVLRRTIDRWIRDESGATAVEYSVLIVFIGLGILAAITGLSGSMSGVFNTLSSSLAGM